MGAHLRLLRDVPLVGLSDYLARLFRQQPSTHSSAGDVAGGESDDNGSSSDGSSLPASAAAAAAAAPPSWASCLLTRELPALEPPEDSGSSEGSTTNNNKTNHQSGPNLGASQRVAFYYGARCGSERRRCARYSRDTLARPRQQKADQGNGLNSGGDMGGKEEEEIFQASLCGAEKEDAELGLEVARTAGSHADFQRSLVVPYLCSCGGVDIDTFGGDGGSGDDVGDVDGKLLVPALCTCIVGFPVRPLVHEVAAVVRLWCFFRRLPFEMPPQQNLNETTQDAPRLEALTEELRALAASWDESDEASRLDALGSFVFSRVGFRGIRTLLRLRITAGSTDRVIPGLNALHRSFSDLHTGQGKGKRLGARLSVGARALSKHWQRGSDGWWGTGEGSESAKNMNAERVLLRILRRPMWMNVHLLPHGVVIFEIRHADGYGARWRVLDDESVPEFRGFLEPHMLDGHDKGWKH